ncbi:hypothetical protein CANARDRAFT_194304 [[Candida] arabinofermentans NRRL YB-2248]|uniref:Uncharacterized protein n=1 Tax=[Candida] arabinofermentans NRRL YB-2248 TaxID=983967 RepID=A0A1E4T5U5_9ASCO|nr:hypothetical protein CANARDRAFT_194304 [[Candida] arabinofermentans NRRL YB-2248]
MSLNIWVAAADDRFDTVKNLIESGEYTANSKDPNGYTPIHAATSYSNLKLLKFLILECNGDVNIQDNDGDTPLHHVEDVETAKLLVELGADINIKNKGGLSCLEYHEEEDEFPDLIEYFKNLKAGITGDDVSSGSTEDGLTLPNGEKVKFVMSDNVNDDTSDEFLQKRELLESIMNNSNLTEFEKDEKLRNFVTDVVSNNLQNLKNDDNDIKRRK